MTSRFYRKNAAKVRFQGAKGVKSFVLGSKRAQKGLKWGPPRAIHSSLLLAFYSQSCFIGETCIKIILKQIEGMKIAINNDETKTKNSTKQIL